MAKASIKSEVTLVLDDAEAKALRRILGATLTSDLKAEGLYGIYTSIASVTASDLRSDFEIKRSQ